jgi:uncharacterized OsmC-like protein
MSPDQIKELYDRLASVLARRPAFARMDGHARVVNQAGLACAVEVDRHLLRADQGAAEGGGGSAPDPDQLMRASLGASVAIGCRIWAARLGIPIDAIELELATDADARGPLGVPADVPIGWSHVRLDAKITSPAPDDAVLRVFETAVRLSPMLANLGPAVRRSHRLTIVRSPLRSSVPSRAAETERSVPSNGTPWEANSNSHRKGNEP